MRESGDQFIVDSLSFCFSVHSLIVSHDDGFIFWIAFIFWFYMCYVFFIFFTLHVFYLRLVFGIGSSCSLVCGFSKNGFGFYFSFHAVVMVALV